MPRIEKRIEQLNKAVLKRDVKAMPLLVKALSDSSPAVRRVAAQFLGQLGSPEAILHLLPLLRDEDTEVRYTVAHALGWIGDSRAVPRLLRSLRDEEPEVRLITVMALGWINDISAAPGLTEALTDTDHNVAQAAAGVLSEMGDQPSLTAAEWNLLLGSLVDALLSGHREARLAATHVLSRMSSVANDNLLSLLYDRWGQDGTSRHVLNETGAHLVWVLLDTLRSTEDAHQEEAIRRLLSQVGEPAVPVLLNMMLDERPDIRQTAGWALQAIGEGAIAPLADALRAGHPERRAAAATMLGRFGEPSLPALIDALRDGDQYTRELCVEPLIQIGMPAAPMLLESILDDDRDVQMISARILSTIGGGDSLPGLSQALSTGNGVVRWAAVQSLGSIGDDYAVHVLSAVLYDRDEHIRAEAAKTLNRLGRAGFPALFDAIIHAREDVQLSATAALAEVSADDLPQLQRELLTADPILCEALTHNLQELERRNVLQAADVPFWQDLTSN